MFAVVPEPDLLFFIQDLLFSVLLLTGSTIAVSSQDGGEFIQPL